MISNEAFAAGFGVSLLGIPTGLAMARFAIADRVVDPYLNILLVAPTAVLIPILIIAVGLGLGSRVIIVVIFTIPLVVVNCHTAVRQIDPSLIEMAHSFGASERQIWQRILLPGALPGIMTGVRVGLGRAIQGMVIVELLMVAAGIGGLIQQYKGFFAAESLYAMVILIIFEALIVVNLARLFERRMAAWAQPARLSE
ncbi:MAG: ABC transporter permease [Nocardioidaceae bacterium]